VTAFLGAFIGIRQQQRGQWLPEIPGQIGEWTPIDVPLDSTTLQFLSNPKTLGRQYKNLFGEMVDTRVISTESFDAFHEPVICMSGYGYTITAQRFIDLFGPGKPAHAIVLKSEDSGMRILMLYWVQYEDGRTTGAGDLHTYADPLQRFLTGWQTVTDGKQSVVVRAYTMVPPTSENSAQARRNLFFVARGLYEQIRQDGTHWRQHAPKPSPSGVH